MFINDEIYIPLKLNRISQKLSNEFNSADIYIPLKLNRILDCLDKVDAMLEIYIPLKLNRIRNAEGLACLFQNYLHSS